MISISGLSKSFGSSQALRDISLTAGEGQIIALVGENGAGKTTLLRCMAGALRPTAGKIEFDGTAFDRNDLEVRRQIFFVPDAPFIYRDWTLLKHLSMVLKLYEVQRPGIEEEAIRILNAFDMLEHVEIASEALSRGQLYKAALCGALVSGARCLLIDEPFASGIDPRAIMALKEELTLLAGDGRVVVYTTQILDIAESLSTQVCILHRGEVEAVGTMDELRRQVITGSGRLEEIFHRLGREPL